MTGTRDRGRRWRCMRWVNMLAHAGAWISAGLLLTVAVRAQTDWVRARILERRSDAAMAYDAARQRVVLFGGIDVTALGDTWEWDGVSWSQRNPVVNPTPRSLHAMAYDAARRRVVLFGGQDSSGLLGDTWEWDGVNWALRNPAANPTP